MDDRRFDAVARALATGTSRRRALKAILGGIAGGLGLRPAPAMPAQVLPPEPTPPSFANQRGVIAFDCVSRRDPACIATGHTPDDQSSFPRVTVQVHNERAFWIGIAEHDADRDVAIVATGQPPDYAAYGLIAPDQDATYTIDFAADRTSAIAFVVDGTKPGPVICTLLQYAIETALDAKNVISVLKLDPGELGDHIAEALVEVVTADKLAQLHRTTPCFAAVRDRSLPQLQACFQNPLFQETAQDIVAKLVTPHTFGDVKSLLLTGCQFAFSNPAWIFACKLLPVADLLTKFADIYQGWATHTLAGNVQFLGYVTGRPHPAVPGGFWIAPADGSTVVTPTIPFAAEAKPSRAGDPAIAKVEFTVAAPAAPGQPPTWQVACTAPRPATGDVYRCEAAPADLGLVPGPLTVSFDVYDRGNYHNLAPNGTRTITWSPPTPPTPPTPPAPPAPTAPTPAADCGGQCGIFQKCCGTVCGCDAQMAAVVPFYCPDGALRC